MIKVGLLDVAHMARCECLCPPTHALAATTLLRRDNFLSYKRRAKKGNISSHPWDNTHAQDPKPPEISTVFLPCGIPTESKRDATTIGGIEGP